ncbi:sensor histidine kinase [Leptospira borgpetersenii]|uniref:sensor histidine kinase n=1 Tax=Leptospira borgpetersenii TaxID=174 RepID=UPI000772E999|nr:sensor histidine kinase [Leptospira borgpetersenii]
MMDCTRGFMFLKKIQKMYAEENFLVPVRAIYLFTFNAIAFVFAGITFSVFVYEGELTYRPSFILLITASGISIALILSGRFRWAVWITLASVLLGISLGIFFGDLEGNHVLSLPILVIVFLLFTNIRTTIFVSLYSFFLMYIFLYRMYGSGGLKTSFVVDSVLGFLFFTLMSVLTVNLLNLYIKEKDELIKEIHHRVRNNLQVLCGLADLHKNDWSDSKKVLIKFQNRILAMSEVHNYLYKSDNYHKIEFSEVIERIVADMKNKNDDFKVNVLNHSERIELPIEIAIPCAMIFNELLNNSFMHAFKETKDPNIEILFSKTGENCNLTIKDNGTGIPLPIDMKKQKTTGFTLVHILSKQIRANVEFFNDNGLVAVLKF